MELEEILATNLKNYREKHNLSQEEVAEQAGICLREYQALEKGNRNATIDKLDLLAAVTGVTCADLLKLNFAWDQSD